MLDLCVGVATIASSVAAVVMAVLALADRMRRPPDKKEEMRQVSERLKKGESIDHFETMRRRKDGSLMYVSLMVSPIKGPAGNVEFLSRWSVSGEPAGDEAIEHALAEAAIISDHADPC